MIGKSLCFDFWNYPIRICYVEAIKGGALMGISSEDRSETKIFSKNR
jgi:hypothetical protein